MGKFKAQNFKRILGTSMATIALFNSTNASIVSSLQKHDVRNYHKMKNSNNKETSHRDSILGIIASIFGVTSLLYAINCQQKLQTLNDKYTKEHAEYEEELDQYRSGNQSLRDDLNNALDRLKTAASNHKQDDATRDRLLNLESDFMCDSIEDFFKLHRAFDGYGNLTPVMDKLMQICTLPCDTPAFEKTIDDLFSSIVEDPSKKECLKNLFLITNTYRFWKTDIGGKTLRERVISCFDGSIPGLELNSSVVVGDDPNNVQGGACSSPVMSGTYNENSCAIKVVNDCDKVNALAIRILKEHPDLKNVCNIYDFTLGKPLDVNGKVVILEKMQKILNGDALEDLISNVESIEKYYETIKDWSIQLFNGIRELHELGLCHHDIRPYNIMFADENMKTLKLVDLDSATLINKNGLTEPALCNSHWAAPDDYAACRSGRLINGEQADVYSAAKVVRWLLNLKADRDYEAYKDKFTPEWQKFFSCCLEESSESRVGSKEALELLKKAWGSGNPPTIKKTLHAINDKFSVAGIVEKERSDIIEFANSISDAIQKSYNDFSDKNVLSGDENQCIGEIAKSVYGILTTNVENNGGDSSFLNNRYRVDILNVSQQISISKFSKDYIYARLYGVTRDKQDYNSAACVLQLYLDSRCSEEISSTYITDSSNLGYAAYKQILDAINKALKLDSDSLKNETLPQICEKRLHEKREKSEK